MDLSIFLGQFWGWYLIIIGLLLLLRGKSFIEELYKLGEDRNFTLISGFVALLFGLFVVILHNVWVNDWRVAITIFGWIAIIKGIMLIGFPKATKTLMASFHKNSAILYVLLVVAIALGGWLVWAAK
ncbi:MAG: hypothetical protein Q8P11_02395 [bacterium]|nr:hypothetical protein [bacterium]